MTLWRSVLRSMLCGAAFAVVFGVVISCGGSHISFLNPGTSQVVRLVSHTTPVNLAVPFDAISNKPMMAGFFQVSSSSTASQLQQTFDGQGPCLSSPGSMPSSGYIPIWFYTETGIGGPFGSSAPLVCAGVFSQIGGGVDQISGQTLSNPGVPMYFSGTLTTLVATGVTVKGNYVRCSDLMDTYSVNDGDLVQPYFVIQTNSVILGIGTTQLPFTCNLNVPTGDQVATLQVQFAKI
jgi:hypothetical protein